jgi:hypothetical protein
MKLLTRKKTPTEQLKHAAVEAAVSALGDLQGRSTGKPALSGVRAVGTGAVLFTAARAAFTRRRFLREQASSKEVEDEAATKAREERAQAEEYRAAKRKPVPRAARTKGPQPSLELPQQRWPRLSASQR